MVPLDLPHLPADLALQLLFAVENLRLPGQQFIDLPQAWHGPQLLQHRLPVLMAQHDVLGNEIRQMAGVPVIHDGDRNLIPQPGGQGGILGKVGVGLAQEGLQMEVGDAGLHLPDRLHVALQIGLCLPQPPQLCPALALHHHAHGGFAQPKDLPDYRHGADTVQILLPGL